MSDRIVVARVDELPPGERRIVAVGGRAGVGIFNVNGSYHAVRNICPHNGAPLCRGLIGPYVRSNGRGDFIYEREGEILKCPWHEWEFDIRTGHALVAKGLRVKTYVVTVEDNEVILHLD